MVHQAPILMISLKDQDLIVNYAMIKYSKEMSHSNHSKISTSLVVVI